MEWRDLKPILGGSAPLIGKLIGVGASFIPGIGPIVGPIIGPAVGNILAGVFGVPATPEAVANAIASNPDEVVRAKLAAATEQIKAQYAWAAAVETGQLKLEETIVTQVNETMRAELLVESPFKTWWRPMNGWVLAVENGFLGSCLVAAIVQALMGNDEPLKVLQDAWNIILVVVGVPAAVVGVNVFSRSQEKMKAMEVTQTAPPPGKPASPAELKPRPTVVETVIQRVAAPPGTRPSPGPILNREGPLPGRGE